MDCPTGENGRSLFDSNGMGSDMVYGFREVVGCFFGSIVGDRSIERGGTGFSAVCFGFFCWMRVGFIGTRGSVRLIV